MVHKIGKWRLRKLVIQWTVIGNVRQRCSFIRVVSCLSDIGCSRLLYLYWVCPIQFCYPYVFVQILGSYI